MLTSNFTFKLTQHVSPSSNYVISWTECENAKVVHEQQYTISDHVVACCVCIIYRNFKATAS